MANNNIKTAQVIIPIKMNGDASGAINEIKKLQQSLNGLIGKSYEDFSPISADDVQKSRLELEKVINIIENSKNLDGSINPFKFDTYAKKAGLSIDEINNKLKKFGKTSIEVESVVDAFKKLPKPVEKVDTAIERLGKTIVNSFRYNIVNDFMDSIINAGQDLFSFYDDIDSNINNIRIVSGRSASAMDGFFNTSIKGAKAMGEVTESYLEASEIFYQQGLSTNEVMARTEATIKASNIAAQDVGTTADQVTALLNGFDISANNIVETLDKVAAVGAGTATDFEEIATASQKVASAASQAGFALDDVLGILATISSVTREAPESIGTSLNAIIGRLNNLTVGDEVSSKIQKAYDNTKSGLSILDEETGLLKDGMQIFEELASVWDDLNRNQQAIITTAMAGTRQANRLMALFNNWDMFETYRDISENSTGALEEQNEIYLESLEAIKNQAQAAKEEIYNVLFDTNSIKDFYEVLTQIEEAVARIIDGVGGAVPLVTNLMATVGRSALLNFVGPSITKRMIDNQNRGLQGSIATEEEKENLKIVNNLLKENYGFESELTNQRGRSVYLTKEQNSQYAENLEIIKEAAAIEEKLNASKQSMFQYQDKKGIIQGVDIENYRNGLVFLQDSLKESSKKVNDIESKSLTDLNKKYTALYERRLGGLKGNLELALKADKVDQASVDKLKEKIKDTEKLLKEKKELLKLEQEAEMKRTHAGGAKELLNNYIKQAQTKGTTEYALLQSKFFDELFNDERINTGAKGAGTKIKNLFSGTKNIDFINNPAKQAAISEQQALDILNRVSNKMTEIGGDELKNFDALVKQLDSVKGSAIAAAGEIENIEKAMKTAKKVETITNTAFGISTLYGALNTLNDSSTTTQEKLEGLTSSIGSFLSLMPGMTGAVGIAISLLGPIFIEVFDIGLSKIEKLNKKVSGLTEAFNQLLEPINQQKKDLTPVIPLYEKLANEYEKNAFAYEDLSEEQKSQYDQVAEYIQNYAPELIKYYDSEGKAVLDLSKGYDYLSNSFKDAQATTYSGLTFDTKGAFDDLVELNKISREQNEELLKQREALQKSLSNATSVKDIEKYQEELSAINKRISENTDIIKNFEKNYTTQIVDPLLKSNRAFLDLNSTIQNTFYSMMSLDNVLSVDTDIVDYSKDVLNIVYAVSSVTEEAKTRFSEMNDIIREGIFRDLSLAKFNQETETAKTGLEQIRDILQNITEEDYLRGSLSFNENLISEKYQADLVDLTEEYKKQKELVSETKKNLENLINKKEISDILNRNIESYVTEENPDKKEELGSILKAQDGTTTSKGYDETVKAINKVIEAQEELIKVSKEKDEFEEKEADKRKEYAKEMQATYTKTITDFAASGVESYNKLLNIYNETEKTLNNEDLLNSMKAALNYDNTEYFNAFREANKTQTLEVQKELGVRAQDYRTYREYTLAIDSAYRKKKELIEIAITEGVEAANEAKLKMQGELYVQQLLQDGKYAEASVYLQADAADREHLIKLKSSKEELLAEQSRIQNELDMLNAGRLSKQDILVKEVNDYIAATNKKIQANAELTEQDYKPIQEIDSSAFSASYESYKTILVDQLNIVNNSISETEDAIANLTNKIQSQAGYDADYYNNLIGDFDNYLQNFNYNIEGFTDLTEKSGDKAEAAAEKLGDASDSLKEIEFDLDPLRNYVLRIEELNHQLDLLAEAKEKAYGSQYVNFLKQEAEINRKIIATEQAKLQKINEITKAKQEELSKYGVQFAESGAIANYNELLSSMQSVSATEEEKKAADNLKDKMDKYETYAIDKMREAQLAIETSKKALAELAQEQIEYPIQLIIDASSRDLELIDFITETQKLRDGKISISIDSTSAANKLTTSLGSIRDIFSELGDADSFVGSVIGNPDLEGDTNRQLEILKNQEDNLKELAGNLMQFLEDFENAFYDALDEAMSIFEEVVNRYDNIVNQYEYLISLSNKLGEGGADYAMKAYDQMEKIYRKNMEGYMDMAEIFKESRDSFDEGTDEWIAANEKYLEAQAGVMEQEKQLAKLLGEKYDVTVSSGRKELENILFGGMTEAEAKKALEEINEIREKYLDTEEKIYELSSMEHSIQEEINKYENNTSAQNKLKKFMEDELKYLNSKEKLTVHDIELSQKQFATLKARIEMEEAQNNKQYTQMLQRNTDGTYGYMYVLDSEENDKAIQDYKDAIDELYQYASDRNKELQEESLKIKSAWLEAYDDITAQLKAGTISEEEAVKKLKEAYDKMIESLKENAEQQAEMQKQMAASKLMQILGVTEQEISGLDNMNEALKKSFDILASNSEFDSSELFSKLNLDFSGMEGLNGGDALMGAFSQLGGVGTEQIEQIRNALLEMGNTTAATVLSLISQMTNLGDVTDQIFNNAIGGSGDSFDKFLDGLTDKIGTSSGIFDESFANSFDSVEDKWGSLQDVINGDLDKFASEFQNTVDKVTSEVVNAYEEYNAVLEDAVDRVIDNQNELISVTEVLNETLDDSISKLEEEIDTVTRVRQNYQELRNEVLEAIERVTDYIETLQDAQDRLLELNDLQRSNIDLIEATNRAANSAARAAEASSRAAHSAMDAAERAAAAIRAAARRDADEIIAAARREAAAIKAAASAAAKKENSSGTKVDTVTGAAPKPNKKSAFHSGGIVGVNLTSEEAMAIVKKNERVLTEEQAKISDRIYENLRKISDLPKVSNIVNNKNTTQTSSINNYKVYAEFPNANDARSIEEALLTIDQKAIQYVNRR